ncbi:right-handed parallel beta-helix repeat-containing protein [Halorubrum sp. PV6]|uniref:right-handed parallel beta-helix repeat-containing protein n=1 Tax=Halorubrum sp. PV6 TaxID=634157 RepID=UPI000F851570|nr:right-handed parallel beta-helix repeat-containing protein [Halorubrum sp. PV6]AZQ13525.1 hypothetical protein DOS48_01085 [Halorubrum sp. PV6]
MTRERLRAIALAAIMLVSMVAVGVGGLAGSAVAQEAGQGEVVVLDQDGNQIENGPYDTVQTAVNNAKDGYTVAVGSGTYEETVVITGVNDVTITAADGAEPVIEGVVRIGDPSDPVGADGTILRGLTIVDPDDSENFDDNNRGVGLTSSDDVVINDVTFEGFKTQVSLDFAGKTPTNVTLTENTFRDGFAAIGSTENVGELTIENNTFDNVVEGVGLGSGVELTADNISSLINANSFQNIDIETQYAVGDYTGGLSPAKYTAQGNLIVQSGDSIESAIKHSGDVGVVQVAPGHYDESVTVEVEGISVVSIKGPQQTIVDGGNQNGFTVFSDNVTIDGFTVTTDSEDRTQNGAISIGKTSDRQKTSVGNTTIINNFLNDSVVGVLDYGGEGEHQIVGNNFTNTGQGTGFAIHGTAAAGDNVSISDNNFNTGDNYGIYIGTNSNNWTVHNNTVSGFGYAGLGLSGTTETVSQNTFSDNGKAIEVFGGESVQINQNTFVDNNEAIVYDNAGQTVDATLNYWDSVSGPEAGDVSGNVDVNPWLDAPITEGGDRVVAATVVEEQFSTIQSAVDAAEDGDTINVHSGQYSENVAIETANVTLTGESNPDINGRIDIRSDEVTVQDLTVQNGAPSGSSEVEGIFVGNSSGFDDKDGKVTIQNVTVEDIHPQGTSKTVEGIHVKHYDSGENIDGLEMINVTIQNVTGPSDAFPKKGANGVKLQAGIRDITIEGSTIDDVEGNYAFGVTSTWSSRESGSPTDVSVSETRISNITPGIGFHVAANGEDDNADQFADPTDITVEQNEFVDNTFDIYNGNTSGTLQAPLNYYGEDADPLVGGNVIYDPLLTTSIEQVNTEERGEIRNYGSYIELNSSGDAVAVGFSAAPDGNASEIFSDLDIEGNAFTYDNDDGYVEVEPDDTFSAGDVVVVTNNGVDEDMIVPIDTSVESEAAQPTSVEVENGWNLVATGAANDVSGITAALGGTGSIADSAVLQTQAKQPGAPPARFGAYGGTWIFVDGSGEISTGYAEDQSPTEYYTELLLTDQTRIDSDDEDGDS